MDKPAVTIVIPNFNGKQLLEICLDSIRHQCITDYQVIVVDNGSTDGSVEFIKNNYPDFIVIPLQTNQGFSHAVNTGIKRSLGKYICLLNNDTELDHAFLSEIIGAFQSNPGIDFCAPKMLSFHNRKILDGAGDGFLRGGVNYRIGTLESDGVFFNTPRIVFGACAGAGIYKREFFDQVGFFDEDFFAYLEDLDINLRAVRFGLTCLYVPTAKVYHMGSATTGSSFNAFTVRQTTRNIIAVLIKNFSVMELVSSMLLILIHQSAWLFIILKKGHKRAYVHGLYLALLDLPKSWSKRKQILKSHHPYRSRRFLRRVVRSEKEVIQSIVRRRKANKKTVWPIQLYLRLVCGI